MASKSKASWYNRLENAAFYSTLIILGVWLFPQLHWLDINAEILSFWQAGQLNFSLPELSLSSIFIPSLVITCLGLLIIQIFPNSPPTWAKILASIIIFILGIRFLVWRGFATLNFTDWLTTTVSIIFLILDICGFLINCGSLCQVSWIINRSQAADILSKSVLDASFTPSVDVFIPTYNEPPELLRRTIIGCQALDYPNKKVYLLDDKRRPEMEALAAELGCYYFKRPDNRHAKAGNLNNALQQTYGELVVFFDADFIPTRNFLTRTVGFFQDGKVALVQTPQNFYNGDPIKHNLGLGNLMTNDQDIFFRLMQCGRDATNTVICCGSCFILRRQALEEIGGIPTYTLCEDFLTSLALQSSKYRVLYLNEALSGGASAENIGGFIDQRLRWGQGTLQALFCPINPLLIPGLNLIQRCFFGLGILSWCMVGVPAIYLLTPFSYLIFGFMPITAQTHEVLFFWLPYYALNMLVFAWLNGGRRSAFWGDIYSYIMAFPGLFMVMRTFIQPFGKGFKVTPKGTEAKGVAINWQAAYPLIITLALYLITLTAYFLEWHWDSKPDVPSFSLFWAIYNTLILIITIQVAVDVPQDVINLRFPHQLSCQLTLGRQKLQATTVDISQSGTHIKLIPRVLPTQLPEKGLLSLPSIGLINLPVELEKTTLDGTGCFDIELKFTNLSLPQERQLINFLFCRPGQWQETPISEVKSLFALIVSIFRLYPLTRNNEVINSGTYSNSAQVIVGQFIDQHQSDKQPQYANKINNHRN